jgi:hypothetical protein
MIGAGAECVAPANEPAASATAATSVAAMVRFEVTARFMSSTSSRSLRASVEGAANATVMAGQRVTNDVRVHLSDIPTASFAADQQVAWISDGAVTGV